MDSFAIQKIDLKKKDGDQIWSQAQVWRTNLLMKNHCQDQIRRFEVTKSTISSSSIEDEDMFEGPGVKWYMRSLRSSEGNPGGKNWDIKEWRGQIHFLWNK